MARLLETKTVSLWSEKGVCAGKKDECKYPLPELVDAFGEECDENSWSPVDENVGC